ncbi:MAG: FAD-binding oxidoreductase, partial [Thermoplasmata archaeon]
LRTGPKVLYTSTGYRLNQLFIGAEGTLGIITEATLRVEPLPEAKDVVMGFFDDFWAALDAAKRTMASGMTFVGGEAYELDDAATCGGPPGKNGVFYVSLEGTKGEVDAQRRFVTRIIEEHGGQIAGKELTERLYGKYTIQWCGARAAVGFEEDFLPYVPVERIKEFYDTVWNDIMPRYGISPTPDGKYAVDIGRYKMVYGKFLIQPGERGWRNYERAYGEILELAIRLGGSVAGCTGIGIKHQEGLSLEYSDVALDVMWDIKRAFDPDNIMNPGKKLPQRKAGGPG